MTSLLLPFKYGNIAENFAFDVTTDQIYWTNGTKIYSSFTNDSGKESQDVLGSQLSLPA